MEEKAEQEKEALSLKAMAESKYKSSNLNSALKYSKQAQRFVADLDGISEMVTSFDILSVASESPTPDWYKILQVEPFAHPNVIRKHYKKLALTLHPDKNPHVASEEAFKLVSEAFRFVSDKIRRKEYDMKLRIRIQDEVTEGSKQQLETSGQHAAPVGLCTSLRGSMWVIIWRALVVKRVSRLWRLRVVTSLRRRRR